MSISPGHTAFTRMPLRASSSAAERVKLITAAFAALYAARPRSPARPDTDATATTAPPPCARMTGMAARTPVKIGVSVTSSVRFHSATPRLSIEPYAVENAHPTKTSSRPCVRAVSATSRVT